MAPIPSSVQLGDNFSLNFVAKNITPAPMHGAWAEITYDASLVESFSVPGCTSSGPNSLRCDLPELGPAGSPTSEWVGQVLSRTKAAGTLHLGFLTHDADGGLDGTALDIPIVAPPPPPPPPPVIIPPHLVAGVWTTYGLPEQTVGQVYAFDAPSPARQARIGCDRFNDAALGPGLPTSFPGMPAMRFIVWKPLGTGEVSSTCYGAWDGEATSIQVAINGSRISGLRVNPSALSAASNRVSFGWDAPPDTQSFLVMIVPGQMQYSLPTSWNAATIIGGGARSFTFDGLQLDTQRQYSVVVYAFSADIASSAPLQGQLNMESASLAFTPAAATSGSGSSGNVAPGSTDPNSPGSGASGSTVGSSKPATPSAPSNPSKPATPATPAQPSAPAGPAASRVSLRKLGSTPRLTHASGVDVVAAKVRVAAARIAITVTQQSTRRLITLMPGTMIGGVRLGRARDRYSAPLDESGVVSLRLRLGTRLLHRGEPCAVRIVAETEGKRRTQVVRFRA